MPTYKDGLADTPIAKATAVVVLLLAIAFVVKTLWIAWPLLLIIMLPHMKD